MKDDVMNRLNIGESGTNVRFSELVQEAANVHYFGATSGFEDLSRDSAESWKIQAKSDSSHSFDLLRNSVSRGKRKRIIKPQKSDSIRETIDELCRI